MRKSVFIVVASLVSLMANAELAVVVHPSYADAISQDDIAKIFLGKAKTFPNGSPAVPINQEDSQSATDEFNNKVLGKSSTQLKAYWSKLVFTGKGTPPKEATNDAQVLELIANNPNMIGYLDASALSADVKVVARF
ncbi:substrate-binding domain-containing protein [Bowmanella sp. JS7-9]|uniref:Substrate-binding domain-containing protein n=1 Tax=Pseudobowmanella zhangzhouensis TaxID=1537679 RepID=A0ABW1XP72_9ALTE|nr:substrate-binding domain-containing protein [Bowmanella sp. JS7-9]TBX21779.1 phosphate ABC transporter substrate-binding protein [Bowmanella sp. JS7-9]